MPCQFQNRPHQLPTESLAVGATRVAGRSWLLRALFAADSETTNNGSARWVRVHEVFVLHCSVWQMWCEARALSCPRLRVRVYPCSMIAVKCMVESLVTAVCSPPTPPNEGRKRLHSVFLSEDCSPPPAEVHNSSMCFRKVL